MIFVLAFPLLAPGQSNNVTPAISYAEYLENHRNYSAEPALFSHIRSLQAAGHISREQAIADMLKYLQGKDSKELVLARYKNFMRENRHVTSGKETLKCLTPLMMEYADVIENSDELRRLSVFFTEGPDSDIQKKSGNDRSVTNVQQYESNSGKFVIQYETTGSRAVPDTDSDGSGVPDYVELTAVYADSSWTHLVAMLGFQDPVPEDGTPVKIMYHNGDYYGRYISGSNSIEVHHNFEGFDPNQEENHAIGALKVTIAHELKHAIQYATTRWLGDSGQFNWIELDATMTEEVVFPTVKDYLNYLPANNSIFNNSQISIPNAYYHVTFGLYFRENFGDEFWVNVWDRLRESANKSMFAAMSEELGASYTTLDREIITNYLWHYASGSRSGTDFGFNDRHLYPNTVVVQPSGLTLPIATSYTPLNRRSARFYEFIADDIQDERFLAGLFKETDDIQLGLIALFRDGTTEISYIDSRSSENMALDSSLPFLYDGISIPWASSDLEKIGVVIVNNGDSQKKGQLTVGTETHPSPLIYGDVNHNETVSIMDAELILDHVIRLTHAPDLSSPLYYLQSDVSADATISPYDASLVLKKDHGVISHFPADVDMADFIPGPGWFRPANEVFSAKSRSGPASGNLLLESELISFTSSVGTAPDDDLLRIDINLDTEDLFYSLYLEVEYDVGLLNFDRFISTSSGVNEQISRFKYDDGKLHLAVSRIHEFTNNNLIRMEFSPKEDTVVTVRLVRLNLDETLNVSPGLSITESVKPKDGVGVDPPVELPGTTQLLSNYPNPFNPSTTIPFELSGTRHVKIDIIDVTGRIVSTLSDEVRPAGYHQVVFNAQNLASGVYLVRMVTMDRSGSNSFDQSVNRILLLK